MVVKSAGDSLILVKGCDRVNIACSSEFADSNKKPLVGDHVYSYNGERMPGDLLIGTVKVYESDRALLIDLEVDLTNLDYVGVLLYDPKTK